MDRETRRHGLDKYANFPMLTGMLELAKEVLQETGCLRRFQMPRAAPLTDARKGQGL